jgi:hypothetical protein
VAAIFENTIFGIQQRRETAKKLAELRTTVEARMRIVSDPEKLQRLVTLRTAIDDVLDDVKD